MKKLLMGLMMLLAGLMSISAQSLNDYKYIVIQHQEEAAKDVEPRMIKEFSELGFNVISSDEVAQLDNSGKELILNAKYRCRQSGECIFQLELINNSGKVVYEDEQIFGGGFMSRKNDRQGAIKRIFKQLKKQNYHFVDTNNASIVE